MAPARRARHRPAAPRPHRDGFEAALAPGRRGRDRSFQNPRQISERVAMGRALWRELVVGFAWQLGELRLGFTQLAALYVLADGGTTTVADLAEALGRSPSATVTARRWAGETATRRAARRGGRSPPALRVADPRGHALLRVVDRARADQFLSAVRPLPTAERALVAMGVAALATHAISRRGRLIRGRD